VGEGPSKESVNPAELAVFAAEEVDGDCGREDGCYKKKVSNFVVDGRHFFDV